MKRNIKQLITNIFTSWKSSILGGCLIVGGLGIWYFKNDWETAGGFITAGLTALISKDYDADHNTLLRIDKEMKDLVMRENNRINKTTQLIEIVQIMHDCNAFKNAEIYNELNKKLKQLIENE